MGDRAGEPAAETPGRGGLERSLERLAADLGELRRTPHPANRARYLARIQRLSGWALRQAVAECREEHGMTWRDAASLIHLPPGTLHRQYRAGGRIVVGDGPPPTDGPHDFGPHDFEAVPESLSERRHGLDFRILGELTVRSENRDVPLPGPRVRALLGALLLTPGDIVGDERLLELAWGTEDGSRRALQCAVHRLRAWIRDLGDPVCSLEHAGTGYRLAVPTEALDIARFQERVRASSETGDAERRLELLSMALSEWRGPVLGGRPEWLGSDPLVRAMEQARIDCAGDVADLAFRLGRSADVVQAVGDVAAIAPYDEPLQARLVRLLSRCGRHAEALRHVEQVRRRLADDLGIAPSSEVKNAHAAALQGDGRFSPIPMQLPADVPDFTGRQDEVRAISDLMQSGRRQYGPHVLVINGPAGVGKTAFAVHTAHRTAGLFADGQLYADLRTPDSRPVDPADVLAGFLGVLGVDGAVLPRSIEDRAALYRSRTVGRGILVLLDNAVDESQVRPLVPGAAGCAVLVTSRRHLAGLAGARSVELDVPSEADAVRLLDRVCGREGVTGDPAAAEVVRLCGHLPLAVRIAGVRLATRPRLSLGRLAAQLRDEDRRLDELAVHGFAVRPSLDLNYRDLAPADRRALRLLGLLRAPDFPAWSAAALLDTSPNKAVTRLDALVDARLLNMLGEDVAGQVRYGLPDLVRLHARERTRAEDSGAARDAALRRALGAWLYLAERAERAEQGVRLPPLSAERFEVPFTLPTCPLTWFDAEAEAVRAAIDQSWAHGFDDLTIALACSALTYYARRGRHDDVRHIRRLGLRAADRGGSAAGRAVLSHDLAHLEAP